MPRGYAGKVDHNDHVRLIRKGVEGAGAVWADFGAGAGAFTLALEDVLGAGAEIHAIDRDAKALQRNAAAMASRFPSAPIAQHVADFTDPLELPPLDGFVAANSLHFQADAFSVLRNLVQFLRPGGRAVVVEYNTSRATFAVPFPIPFEAWERMAAHAGFERTELLVRRPSRTFTEIYSAVSVLPRG